MVLVSAVDYLSALIGGILIGCSTTLNYSLTGRITGMSGIFNTVIRLDTEKGFHWKFACFLGLLTGALCFYWGSSDGVIYASTFSIRLFDAPHTQADLHWGGWILAGLLVGAGTQLGNGCTSGHAVCGLPRFSLRSFIATGTFMFFGFAIATARYWSNALYNGEGWGSEYNEAWMYISIGIYAVMMILGLIICLLRLKNGTT